MSVARLESIAREAEQLAATMERAAAQLGKLGEQAAKVIGGTVSQTDMQMMNEASTAVRHARQAANSFAVAGDAARKAALRERERTAARPSRRAVR